MPAKKTLTPISELRGIYKRAEPVTEAPEPYTGITGGYVELVALLKDLQRRFIAGSDIHKKLEHAIKLAE